MEITKDEITNNINEEYAEFELSQFITQLSVGEKLEILVDGNKIKEYIAKYSNCHFNMKIQDKGEKRVPTPTESIQAQIDRLELEKEKLQEKQS